VYFDWYWRRPLVAGLTELWLAKRDLVRARGEAERFLEIALAAVERTWQGLAWEINARGALADGDFDRARLYLEGHIHRSGPGCAFGRLASPRDGGRYRGELGKSDIGPFAL
jgi:hypothetical protein